MGSDVSSTQVAPDSHVVFNLFGGIAEVQVGAEGDVADSACMEDVVGVTVAPDLEDRDVLNNALKGA